MTTSNGKQKARVVPNEPDEPSQEELDKQTKEAAAKVAAAKEAEEIEKFSADGYPMPIGLQTFIDNDYSLNYLIEDILCELQPCTFAGASKTLKTTLSLHAALCLASGKPFLRKFKTQQVPVLFASSESGEATLKRNLIGLADMMDIDLKKLAKDGLMSFQFWVPKFNDTDLMRYFEKCLKRSMSAEKGDIRGAMILDPLYHSLDGETAMNLSLNGEQIKKLTKLCIGMGVTPVVDDHVKRSSENAQRYQPIALDDISGAGKAEFFRQWVLLGRRSRFNDFDPDSATRTHDLWMTAGGSPGHSGTWALDVAETLSPSKRKIEYTFTLRKGSELKEERKEAATSKKEKEFLALVDKSLRWIKGRPNEPFIAVDIRDNAQCSGDKAGQIIAHLVNERIVRKLDDTVKRGRNRCDAWILTNELPLS